MKTSENLIVLARFGKTHGIGGNISLTSFCEPAENIFRYPPPLLCAKKQIQQNHHAYEDLRPIRLISEYQKQRKNTFIVAIAGITSVEQAWWFMHSTIHIPRNQLGTITKGFYWCDIIGMQVLFIGNKQHPKQNYGKLIKLTTAGDNDIMHISNASGKDILIPFIEKSIVVKVDNINRIIAVDWPPDYIM